MSDIIKLLPCVDSEMNDKAMRAILDGVDYLIAKEIKDAPFDKVYTGVIKTVNGDNTYDLTIGGNLYKGVPSMFKASFVENDTVKVVSPQNQMGNIFIFGKMNMEVSGSSEVTNVAWDVISDKPSDLVQDAQYVHTDNNYTTLEKEKLNTIEEGAQKNTITGIKGDAETSYRQGDVNITKANIGLDKVDNTPDAEKTVENATKLGNQAPDYYATAQSVADENERATIAEQENSALIGSEIKRAESAENDLSTKLTAETERAQKAEKANTDAIEVLNGEATVEGSVAYKIAQIVNENDNGSIDTLKEIASWINDNPNSATAMQKQITENKSAIDTHIKNTDNPHNVTKAQIGLSNVDNTSDADKPISTATQKALDLKTNLGDFNAHIQNTENPHKVTASQVGLGNVPNVATNNQTPTYTVADKISNLTSGEKLSVAFGKIAKAISDLIGHIANTSNPHKVTKSQVGLGNVSNYDQSKAIKSITRNGLTYTCTKLDGTTEEFDQQDENDNTTYTLTQDSTDGHILYFTPSNGAKQTITIPDKNTTYELVSTTANGLMSYSDKIKLNGIESGAQKNTVTGIKGDAETAYRQGNVNITKENIGLSNVENKNSATIRNELTKENVTKALGYTPPTTNTTYNEATTSNAGLMSASDKSKLNGIAVGAQVNTVTSVAGKTGAVTLTKSDVGLGNVDNTKDVDKNVASAQALNLMYGGRQTSANLATKGDGKIRCFLATSTMTEGKPMSDGYIVHFAWDNKGGWDEELFIPAQDGNTIQFRTQTQGVWGNWHVVYSSMFKPSKADVGLGNVDNTADSAKSVKYATSAGNVTGTVAVSHGGTGATSASGARKNLGIGTLGTKNEIGKGDLALKIVNGNTIQLVNASGTVISEVAYTPKIEWNQNTFTSYVWNE